jgi:putative PIN family toxin of toxin-antitoxin system
MFAIAYNINMIVIDTNVLVAALRSTSGYSRALIRRVLQQETVAGVSIPLFLEYEAVLTRPKQLAAFGLSERDVTEFLDGLAFCLAPIEISYLWRPQLRDPADEMVLEAAVNGRASSLVTWNVKDFGPAAHFGIDVITPTILLANLTNEEK